MRIEREHAAAVESLRVHEGEAVDLAVEDDALIVRPARPSYTIEDLVSEMRPEDAPEILDDVTAPPLGDERL